MTAILVLAGVLVVAVAVIVLVAVPVRHVEATVSVFAWHRTVRIGTRVWVKRQSRRKPSGPVRNVEIRNGSDPARRFYAYEEQVWRKMRKAGISGNRQDGVRSPPYTLGKGEEVRRKSESYRVTFVSEEGRSYAASVSFHEWQCVTRGVKYRLGRNAFGVVRTFNRAAFPDLQRNQEKAEQDS
jgi:hypothetical protein